MKTDYDNYISDLFTSALPLCLNILQDHRGLKALEFIPKEGPLSLKEKDKYLSLFLPPDFAIGRTTMLNNCWQIQDPMFFSNTMTYYKQCCLIDVGANVGLFTRQLLNLSQDKINKIFLYEPDLVNFDLLIKNIPSNKNTVFENAGLSSLEKAKEKLFKDPNNCGNYSLYENAMFSSNTEYVNVLMKSAQKESQKWLTTDLPLFYKSDTQGHDITIASALNLEVWKNIKCAMLELWPFEKINYDLEKFAEILNLFPYKVFSDAPQKLISVNDIMEFINNHQATPHSSKDIYLSKIV